MAREELNYGVDPLFGEQALVLGFRILSNMRLSFDKFSGDMPPTSELTQNFSKPPTMRARARNVQGENKRPTVFQRKKQKHSSTFTFTSTSPLPKHCARSLLTRRSIAPSGVYIMRIHGTFVNFLDLSPAILAGYNNET
jgi:formate C-acetyltransferase